MNRKDKKWIIIGITSMAIILAIIISITLLSSENPLDSNTKNVKIDLDINQIQGTDLISDSTLFKKYQKSEPEMMALLTNNYKSRDSEDSTSLGIWKSFFAKPYVKSAENEIQKTFKDNNQLFKNIIEAFKRLKFHFPKKEYPQNIIFANTNFGRNIYYLENGTILVGCERYIGGSKTVIKDSLPPQQFPKWMKSGFEKKYLLRDLLVSTLLKNETIPSNNQEKLINKMIYWGKIFVITEMALRIGNRDIEPEILLRWNSSQFDWAEKNEKAIYEYFIKNSKRLFSINDKDHAFVFNNAPYTIGFSEKSPDRLGQYLGWKMVRNYIFEEELPLSAMVKLEYRDILKKYKP